MAMKQQTLTEIDNGQELARRAKVRANQMLTEQRDTLVNRAIPKLESQLAESAASATGIKALSEIHERCALVPNQLPTSGSRFVRVGSRPGT